MLECAVALMVGVERSGEGPPPTSICTPGSQGFWLARMAARLGARVTLAARLAHDLRAVGGCVVADLSGEQLEKGRSRAGSMW